MASTDIHYVSFSDEDIPEPTESFRSADLPIISKPTTYDSDTLSSSESEYPESSTIRTTPTNPASPATSLGAAFSYVGLSSQTSNDQLFHTPQPKRKRLVKRKQYHYKMESHQMSRAALIVLEARESKSFAQLRPYIKIFILKGKPWSRISNSVRKVWNIRKIFHLQQVTRL